MGGGNGAKAAHARAKKMEAAKKATGGQSQLAVNAKAANIVCQVCRNTFLMTASVALLTDHASNKHPKSTFAECFPDKA